MNDAGFSMDGPRYNRMSPPPYWDVAESLGMKNYWNLYIDDYDGERFWGAVLPRMKTAEGRAFMKKQIEDQINHVQSDLSLNSNIAAWYGYPEEPFERSTTPIDEQRAYVEFVHDIIKTTDRNEIIRPYYVIERGDSSLNNMILNQCHQDGSMRENYLIQSNDWEGDDDSRVLMWQWARDQVVTAEWNNNDPECPSNTGKQRAAISVLEMFRDPRDKSKRNEEWLRKIITHDVYIQLAAGIDGFALFSWTANSSSYVETRLLQQDIYLEVLGKISKSDLGKVFLWGDDRNDIQMEIVSGPETVQWKYGPWFTSPSIRMRNIQYGRHRYILLVNSSKEVVETRLSEFPPGLKILDMISDKWYDLGSSITPIIQPLGVKMYKIEQK